MKNRPFLRLLAMLLVAASLLAFAGCRKAPEKPAPTTAPTTAPTVPTEPVVPPAASIVELGNIVADRYEPGHISNCAWDLAVWDGVLFRCAGDYDDNTGLVPIWGFDLASQSWKLTGEAKEEAIHRFVKLGAVMATPGIDPLETWTWGNFYVWSNGWHQYRNLPGGIHNFDIVEFEGKIFAGLGVDENKSPCVVSTDGGVSFQHIPLYRDGKVVDSTGMTFIRIYEFIVYQNQLYAMAYFEGDWGFYRYEGDKFVYISSAASYVAGSRTNYNYLNAKFQFGDTCFVVSNRLHAVKDFADNSANKIIAMPNNGDVVDALVADGGMYTLSYTKKADGNYETVIYRSATGQEGSFTEVLRFDYAVPPCSFALDAGYFYIGMGSKNLTHIANGMVLRATMPQ